MRWMAIGLVMLAMAGCQADSAATRAAGAPAASTSKPAATGAKGLLEQGKIREALPVAQAEWTAAQANAKAAKAKRIDAALVLAEIQMRLAVYKDTAATLAQAMTLLDSAKDDDQLLVARVENALGELSYVQADWDVGLTHARKALAIRTKRLPADDLELSESLGDVGFMLAESEDAVTDKTLIDTARKDLLRSWQIRLKRCGADSPEAGEAWNNLGLFFISHDAGDEGFLAGVEGPALAERCLKKGLDIRRKALAKGHPDLAESLANLAYFYFLQEKTDDADKCAKEALDIVEKAYGRDHPDCAYTLNILGQIRQKQERTIEAEALFVRAQGIYEKTFGPNHYYVGSVLERLMELYDETGQKDKVAPLRKRLDRIKGRDI